MPNPFAQAMNPQAAMNGIDPRAWAQTWAACVAGLPFTTAASAEGSAPGGAAPATFPSPWAPWLTPLWDPEELDRRIRELQAVHLWLDQQARALQALIQALQVQRMTLAALRSMPASAAARAVGETSADSAAAPANPQAAPPAQPDPLPWWQALSQQFQALAAQTLADWGSGSAPAAAGANPMPAAAPSPPPSTPAARSRRAGGAARKAGP
ncbi:hypothetical protein Talka_02263 [Tepidimonas alkaliphilus]|uniref:Uncharacterized protein n=1 Tax=Tepidimonas alkaliphilus TaxID=2588942 RepID=A0A554W3Y6_9BURK|nr:hypothetical protein Talka_02263 [Tepidimonas alkaliphilus]